ncbi:hypothetical protein LDG_8433 [Legionella drancourtii LLAP12]|uniref:Uncharacterized protein n=1 Tax=Legionella drancourtii LLAP12 TaxID=658187 RepID=G9ET04_9GAMM|nr:hypothetical protein LDG_8433 [Legionella drancourtii LLAP12]
MKHDKWNWHDFGFEGLLKSPIFKLGALMRSNVKHGNF